MSEPPYLDALRIAVRSDKTLIWDIDEVWADLMINDFNLSFEHESTPIDGMAYALFEFGNETMKLTRLENGTYKLSHSDQRIKHYYYKEG
jgi:hypothetical protein